MRWGKIEEHSCFPASSGRMLFFAGQCGQIMPSRLVLVDQDQVVVGYGVSGSSLAAMAGITSVDIGFVLSKGFAARRTNGKVLLQPFLLVFG